MKFIRIKNSIEYSSLVLVFSFFIIHNIYLVLLGIVISLYLINKNTIDSLYPKKINLISSSSSEKNGLLSNLESSKKLFANDKEELTLVETIEELGIIPSIDRHEEDNSSAA